MSVEMPTTCSGHPVTHARHWMHEAYDSESVFRPGSDATASIAPVGHDRAHWSQAVQRLKSISGNPNDACAPNGFTSVTTPVFRLFAMMRSMSSCLAFGLERHETPEKHEKDHSVCFVSSFVCFVVSWFRGLSFCGFHKNVTLALSRSQRSFPEY